MTIGDLTANHITRVIRMEQLPGPRVLLGVRHFTVDKAPKTSLLYRDPSAKPNDPCSEYVGSSGVPVVVASA